MPDGAIQPRNRSDIVANAKANFIAKLELEAELTPPSMFGDEIAMALLNATNEEEFTRLLEQAGLPASKDLVGVEHEILDIVIQKGNPEFEDNSYGFFWLVDAAKLSTGEEFRYTAGGKTVVIALWQWRQFGRIPGIQIVYSAKPAAVGNTILVKEVPKRAVKAKTETSA